MSRQPDPDGHRIHVNIKLSGPEAEIIDAARGDLERGPWMRQAALAVARRDSGIPLLTSLGGIPLPPGTITAVSAWREDGELKVSAANVANVAPDTPAPKPRNCKHPNLRLTKGVCPDCREYVSGKKS